MTTLITASPDDLNYQRAYNAHRNTSHVPDERAKQRQAEYVQELEHIEAAMLPLATTEAQRTLLAQELERYRLSYLTHMHAVLDAQSRTASAMITGPANFPTRQNARRLATAQRRVEEFLAWRDKARAAIRRALEAARTPEAQHNAAWADLRIDLALSLTTIAAVDAGNRRWNRSAFVNSIAGKVERLARAGELPLVEQALALVTEYNEIHAKPAITSRHVFWAYADVARAAQAATVAAASQDVQVLVVFVGAQLIDNSAADRTQLVFDERPVQAVVDALKSSGWNYSRTNGAWQRQRTEAARYAGRQILTAHYAAVEKPA